MRKAISIIVLALVAAHLFAQQEPEREIRATWVASVSNIDWPKSSHRNQPELQKADLISMLDLYKSMHLNSVFLQVRTECDALYNSAYEPWSRFLSTNQGDNPGYDPLAFAIEEAHKRGIELHAWMNPYRINFSASDGGNYYHETHVYKEHPEWAITYSTGKKILNPGLPEVMSYIGSVVRDLVSKYKVDGVHFDDYFYAYGGTSADLDAAAFAQYGGGLTLSDWRRNNINRMMDTVYKVIQEENPFVRFGVSPFGIYKSGTPSGISGMSSYSEIYCDPLAWLQRKSVDYLCPQLYWPTGGAQDFETLVNWWADQVNANSRHLVSGHATYKVNEVVAKAPASVFPSVELSFASSLEMSSRGTGDPVAAWSIQQISLQIDLMRKNYEKGARGSCFFSASDFDEVTGLADYLLKNNYNNIALWPEMSWKSVTAPVAPANLRISNSGQGNQLTWDYSGEQCRFAIYVTSQDITAQEIVANPANLKNVVFTNSILLSDIDLMTGARIVVVAVHASGKAGAPSAIFQLSSQLPSVTLYEPTDKDTVNSTAKLKWSTAVDANLYLAQISTMESFSAVDFESGWISDTTLNIGNYALEGRSAYFWRVKAKGTEEGLFSEIRKFVTGFPEKAAIASPVNLATNVSTNPVIGWNASNVADSVKVQISTKEDFSVIYTEQKFLASDGSGVISSKLAKDTWHYVRIQASNHYGNGLWSNSRVFKTTAGEIPDAYLIGPESGALLASFDSLKWNTQTTQGSIKYSLEISMNSDFSATVVKTDWLSAKSMRIETAQLEGMAGYFWRVRAKSEYGEGDYSQVRDFLVAYPVRPQITAPEHYAENVQINPVVEWTASENTDSVYIEFSKDTDFSKIALSGTVNAKAGKAVLPGYLEKNTGYFVHLKPKNNYGYGLYSNRRYFETGTETGLSGNELTSEQCYIYPAVLSIESSFIGLYSEIDSSCKVEIYTLSGLLVQSNDKQMINRGESKIVLEHTLNQGMYIFVLSSGTMNKQFKLIVR